MDGPRDAGERQDRARIFYAADPADYYRERLGLLTVRAAGGARLAEAMRDGIAWGPIRLGAIEPGEDLPAADAFVLTESLLLQRQSAETLLRLFVVHAEPTVDPWAAASGLGSAELRRAIEDLAAVGWPSTRLDQVAAVFLGGTRPEPSREWIATHDACVRLLRILAQRWLGCHAADFAASYAVSPTDADPIPDPHQPDGPGWSRVLGPNQAEWTSPSQNAWLTHLTIHLIGALWTVARSVHLGTPLDDLHLITPAAVDAVEDAFESPKRRSSSAR